MYYDKIIRYLEYFENGEKIKSAGFVKIEILDQVCNIQVNVTGLYPMESCNREVHLTGRRPEGNVEGVLGEIMLQAGKGNLIKKRVAADRLCEGIGYDELMSVRINLGKSRELICRWAEEEAQKQQEEELSKLQAADSIVSVPRWEPVPEPVPEPVWVPVPEPDPSPGREVESEEKPRPEQTPQESSKPEPDTQELPEPELLAEAVRQETVEPDRTIRQPEPVGKNLGPSVPSPLHDKKWRQLSEIYPHIAPFRDERDYLSIGPGDFVILPEKYYRLISNSFLLHGYYNYGHMVLAKGMKKGEEVYYVGVPGNFYEKERQVAVMFGFESFECRQEPARDGDFGYYMMRVEL